MQMVFSYDSNSSVLILLPELACDDTCNCFDENETRYCH